MQESVMKHLNIVTKDMNINASDEEDLKLVPCTFFFNYGQ